MATGLEKAHFHFNSKEGQCQSMFNYGITVFISHASRVIAQNPSSWLHMWTKNIQMYKLDTEKTEEPEMKMPTSTGSVHWTEKGREFQENFCFIEYYNKAFDCVDHNKLWKSLKEMAIPDHLTCLLRNLYAGEEAIVRTRHGTMGLVQNWARGTTRLDIVTLLI